MRFYGQSVAGLRYVNPNYVFNILPRFHCTLFPLFPLSALYLLYVFIVLSLLVADTGTIGDVSCSQARTFGFSVACGPLRSARAVPRMSFQGVGFTLLHSVLLYTHDYYPYDSDASLLTSFLGTLLTSCRHRPNLKLIFLSHILYATSQRRRQGQLSTHPSLLWPYASTAPLRQPLTRQSLVNAHSIP